MRSKQAGAHLYFIQSAVTGAIKIGRSKDPKRRLGQLQTGSPHKLRILLVIEDMGHRERKLHRRLRHHKIRYGRGEWFGPDCLWDLPVELYELFDLEILDWWKD